MTGVIATIPRFQFSSAQGNPLVNGMLYTYLAGTNSPAKTYQDQALTIENTNPVRLDARGECVLWLDPARSYKFVLKSALGVTQWAQDDVAGALASNRERPAETETQVAVDGQKEFTLKRISYTPGINSLKVYVDGFRLSGAEYAETARDTIIFKTGLRAAQEVLFETGSGVNSQSANDASMVPYFPAGETATNVAAELSKIRNKQAAFQVTPQDFMTEAQKTDVRLRLRTLDISAAVQSALDALNAAGGGRLHFPAGDYRKADSAPTWVMYSNITISGDGDASVIFHDDRDTTGRRDLLVADNCSNIAFENFRISGTALTYANEVNQSQTLTGSVIDGLRMTNVTIEKVRYMATAFNNVKNAVVYGCRLDYVVRDGLRFTNSNNIAVIGNNLRRVCDDSIALHSLDASAVPGGGFYVSENTFDQCQGMKILGAKALTVTRNVMRRSLRSPIRVSFPNSGSEGNSQQFAVSISGNTILDTFGSLGTNYYILVESAARSMGGLTAQPGINAPPFPYNYLNDLDVGTQVKLGQFGIDISDNIVGRTLPDGAPYSAYGFGQLFDRITPGFFSDPVMTAADFQTHGISISGPTKSGRVSRNQIFGMGTGYNAIWMQGSAGNLVDLDSLLIDSNILTDCPGIGLSLNFTGSSARNVIVRNNVFDLDPYFRAASHAADGTWSSSGSVIAIRNGATVKGLFVDGNTFKNCGNTVDNITDLVTVGTNYVFADVITAGDSVNNKGVRFCSVNNGFVYVIIDADPLSTTYGQVTTMPRSYSTAMPAAGKYVQGHYVRKSTPSVAGSLGSQYTVIGWWRATIGSNHVSGTDWIEQRAMTGT